MKKKKTQSEEKEFEHSEETKKKISDSMKEFHASGLKALKKTIRKISKGVYKSVDK